VLFTGQYLARLLSHGVADLAMNEVRVLTQDQWDWGIAAIARKRAFEMQISPSLRRSRELLERSGVGTGSAQAA
jgi:hypothetical protein